MTGTNPDNVAAALLSGGLDSMVAAALARERGHEVHALTIDYGQRHVREIEAARKIAKALGLASHREITLDLRKFGGSALTADIDVPKDGVDGTIPVTYVPARNLVFLALTTAFAESIGAGRIVIGVNALASPKRRGWAQRRGSKAAVSRSTPRSSSSARPRLRARRTGLGSILHSAGRVTTREGMACRVDCAIAVVCAARVSPMRG